MSDVVGVVLAAGSGTRMGTPKAEIVVAGERLVDRAVRVLRDGGCPEVIAVTRAGVDVPGARLVVNPAPQRGMRSSLELAVDAAGSAAAVAVVLVDTPGVTAEAVRAACAAWRPGRVVVARYGGRRGHPTVMAPVLWREALARAGADEGARALLRARPELVDEVDGPGSADDLDTPDELARWERAASIGVRDAAPEDLPVLRDIYRCASLANVADAPALRSRPELLELAAGPVLDGRARVAVIGGQVVGFAVYDEGGETVEIDKLFVDPDRWRSGVGRALVEDALARAGACGARQVELTANGSALAFYERLGFDVVGRVETELGPAPRLRRPVS